jgi:hypothetical protein
MLEPPLVEPVDTSSTVTAALLLLGNISETVTVNAINKTQTIGLDWVLIFSPFQCVPETNLCIS